MSQEHYSYYNARNVLNQQNREMRQQANRLRDQELQVKQAKKMAKYQQKQLGKLQKNDAERSRQIKNMSKQMQTMNSSLGQRIDTLDQHLSARMDTMRNELKNDINILRNEIESKEASKREIASALLKDAKDAISIIETYRHEKFKPGAYSILQSRLDIAKSNYQNDMYEATVSDAQNLIMDAYSLRAELMMLEEEWNDYREEAFKVTGELLTSCEAGELVEYMYDDENGKSHQIEVEVDYWSGGDLAKIAEEIKQDQKNIEEKNELNVEDLKTIIEKSPELQERLQETIERAQNTLLVSQLRRDMAEDIESSLYEDGYEIVDSTYEGEDPREPLWVKYENQDQDEIITIIRPREDMEIGVEYHFSTVGDDTLYDVRTRKIDQQISEVTGIDTTFSECQTNLSSAHEEIVSLHDLDSVRHSDMGISEMRTKGQNR